MKFNQSLQLTLDNLMKDTGPRAYFHVGLLFLALPLVVLANACGVVFLAIREAAHR